MYNVYKKLYKIVKVYSDSNNVYKKLCKIVKVYSDSNMYRTPK